VEGSGSLGSGQLRLLFEMRLSRT